MQTTVYHKLIVLEVSTYLRESGSSERVAAMELRLTACVYIRYHELVQALIYICQDMAMSPILDDLTASTRGVLATEHCCTSLTFQHQELHMDHTKVMNSGKVRQDIGALLRSSTYTPQMNGSRDVSDCKVDIMTTATLYHHNGAISTSRSYLLHMNLFVSDHIS